MSTQPNSTAATMDAFTRFWSDFMTRMASGGVQAPPAMGTEGMKQAQRIFFDAMAKYADDFMRSPAFLESLKQTMDNAMAMKQQIDSFIMNSLKASQMPTRQDTDYAIEMLHGIDRRLSSRLDDIESRLAAMEGGGGKRARESGERPKRS